MVQLAFAVTTQATHLLVSASPTMPLIAVDRAASALQTTRTSLLAPSLARAARKELA